MYILYIVYIVCACHMRKGEAGADSNYKLYKLMGVDSAW